MTVSFKNFTAFLVAAEGERSHDRLSEIWDRIIAGKKEKEDEDKAETDKVNKTRVLTAKERLEKKKEEEAQKKKDRKAELEAKREENFQRARETAMNGPRKSGKRDEYSQHAALKEGRESYDDMSTWKEAAKAAGYKVKKLAGDADSGDQSWGAFEEDVKKGVFSEQDENGWLIQD